MNRKPLTEAYFTLELRKLQLSYSTHLTNAPMNAEDLVSNDRPNRQIVEDRVDGSPAAGPYLSS